MPPQHARAGLAQLHDRADVLARREDHRLDDRLVDLGDLAGRASRCGLVTTSSAPSSSDHPVDDVRRGEIRSRSNSRSSRSRTISRCSRPRKPHAEAEAERRRGLRLVDQRGVVEPQLVQRVAQQRVVASRRSDTGRRRPSAWGRGSRRAARVAPWRGVGDGVADAGLPDVLHAGDQVADLADAEPLGRHRLGRDDADLEHLVGGSGRHHQDPLARCDSWPSITRT